MRYAAALCFLVMVLALTPTRADAEWQVRPFLGGTFGGATTFIDSEQAVGKPNPVLGVSGGVLGEVLGVEGDVGYAPGFFQTGSVNLVSGSSVTTVTGNLVVALPRRLAQYSLRPYIVGGAGLMKVRIQESLDVLQISSSLLAIDVGGGVTGFLTNRIGLNWDVRRFASRSKNGPVSGTSFGPEDLSFWRATMALAIRL